MHWLNFQNLQPSNFDAIPNWRVGRTVGRVSTKITLFCHGGLDGSNFTFFELAKMRNWPHMHNKGMTPGRNTSCTVGSTGDGFPQANEANFTCEENTCTPENKVLLHYKSRVSLPHSWPRSSSVCHTHKQ